MRVTSDRQTLILAGEMPPRRPGTGVELAPANSYTSLPAIPPTVHQAYVVSSYAANSYAAEAYARTRDLTDRTSLIDTYA